MSRSRPMLDLARLRARALVRAGRGLAIGSALALGVVRSGDAAAAQPGGDEATPEAQPPAEPDAGKAPTEAPAAEPSPEPGAAPGAGEGLAAEAAEVGSGEPSPAIAPAEAAPAPTADEASAAASPKVLPSGHAKTDDVPVDEAQRERDRRAGRRLRSRERDEGHWQVFAPYPELGPIRYRDPEDRRTLWLGLDAAGTYLPSSFGLADQAVWAVRPGGAWAFSLTPWLALGGRHEVEWYDAEARRIRVHGHQVELSSRPLAASRSTAAIDDRLALGLTTHAIRWTDEDAATSDGTGPSDTILHIGYGLDHLLGTRWRLGWHAQARHAWIPRATQRQVRLSARVAFNPRPAHRLSLDAVGYYVNRNHPADPAGDDPLPRHSVHGQLGLGYAWMGRAGVGPWTNVRATSHFRSGEAPVYELREEALDGAFGEVLVGMMARWP